jgi:hypothetical protein
MEHSKQSWSRSQTQLTPLYRSALVPRHDLPPSLGEACRVYFQVLPSQCVLAMSSHVMTNPRVLLKLILLIPAASVTFPKGHKASYCSNPTS